MIVNALYSYLSHSLLESDGGIACMADQADGVVVLKVVEGFAELLLSDLLHSFVSGLSFDGSIFPFGL